MKQDAWKRVIVGIGGTAIVLFAYGSGMRGQKKALEGVKQERRVLREDMRNLQLITRGREGLLHQYAALLLLESAMAKKLESGKPQYDQPMIKQAVAHLETSKRLDATTDADVDDLVDRLLAAKNEFDVFNVASELRKRLQKIDIPADLETPVTIKAPSLNDVPKQPGPEIGR
ncbi:MAG: hypothetical protein ACKO14_07310 [Armatimonadota bacterium]